MKISGRGSQPLRTFVCVWLGRLLKPKEEHAGTCARLVRTLFDVNSSPCGEHPWCDERLI